VGVLTGPLPLIPPKGVPGSQQKKSPSVVALGGGHGLAASLSALRLLTSELTAIVTVADDGGSLPGVSGMSTASSRPETCGWRSVRPLR
jgi:hypothetical protein